MKRALAAIGAFALSCGGQEQPGIDGGPDATTTDGGPSDGATFGDVSADVTYDALAKGPCPTSAPIVDASCASIGLECEYGSSWYVACDPVYTCTDGGTWSGGATATCVDAGGCPADPDAGMTCTSSSVRCDYSDRHCECANQCGGPCCGSGPTWQCHVPATQGCPYPRPDIGSACSTEGQQCSYGSCCDGSLLSCNGGLWRQEICIPPP